MTKMFKIGDKLLRECSRMLNRDNNTGQITLALEPIIGTNTPYERGRRTEITLDITPLWDLIKNGGQNILIETIDTETQRYKAAVEAHALTVGEPAPYPLFFADLIHQLAVQEYMVIEK